MWNRIYVGMTIDWYFIVKIVSKLIDFKPIASIVLAAL